MSVTDIQQTNKRNGWLVTKPECILCRKSVLYFEWTDGRLKRLSQHCAKCHSNNHDACETCGECMPDWTPWRDSGRSDKRHCSAKCKQKAYRLRNKERKFLTPDSLWKLD